MNDHPPTKTRIRMVENKTPVLCYVCDADAKHPYWDPESNGHICRECLQAVLVAEANLTSTPGICRPQP